MTELRQRHGRDRADDDRRDGDRSAATKEKSQASVQTESESKDAPREKTTEGSATTEPQKQRPPTQTGKQSSRARHQKELSPVMAQGAVSSSAILALSFIYAWNHAAQRVSEVPNSPVSKYLDLMALQHVSLLVANLSRSTTFYTEVLGGAEVSLGPAALPMIAFGNPSTTTHWRAVHFGSSLVVLCEADQNNPLSTNQPQLAFRLKNAVNVTEFCGSLRERFAPFDDFSSISCSEQFILADWDIVACRGPDNEAVQFWHASSKALEKKFNNARRAWSQIASDSRARDLFE